MAPLKVLIVGAGVAGPPLAYWLTRTDAHITIVERYPELRALGHQVDLRAQGIPIMRKMGIEAAIRSVCVHEPGTQFINKTGKVQAYFPAAQTGTGKQSMTSEFEIMRGDMVRVLYDLTKDHPRVTYRFGTSIEALRQDDETDPDGKVHVRLSDGTSQDYDLVVGADGTGSKTRRLMYGVSGNEFHYPMGCRIAYFTVPDQPGDSRRWTNCHLPGRRMLGTRKDSPDNLRVYMAAYGDQPAIAAAEESNDVPALKRAWADLFHGAGWQADRFCDALLHAKESDDIYSSPLDQIRMPEGGWSKGRVVLVGDAAYGPTPVGGGLGSTLGLVGAYILAGEIATLLRKDPSQPSVAVIEGAKLYEKVLRPLATSAQDVSPRLVSALYPETDWGVRVLHTIMWLAALLRLDKLAGMMPDDSGSWKLPDYPALETDKE